MAGISNTIEFFLLELLQEASDGSIEIKRNELAERFGCAPSQINYVLTTRFTPYKGYIIESRRGGSGYIRIVKLQMEMEESLSHLLKDTIGHSITKDKASHVIHCLLDEGVITQREAQILKRTQEDVSLQAVPNDYRNTVRADLLKNTILILID